MNPTFIKPFCCCCCCCCSALALFPFKSAESFIRYSHRLSSLRANAASQWQIEDCSCREDTASTAQSVWAASRTVSGIPLKGMFQGCAKARFLRSDSESPGRILGQSVYVLVYVMTWVTNGDFPELLRLFSLINANTFSLQSQKGSRSSVKGSRSSRLRELDLATYSSKSSKTREVSSS